MKVITELEMFYFSVLSFHVSTCLSLIDFAVMILSSNQTNPNQLTVSKNQTQDPVNCLNLDLSFQGGEDDERFVTADVNDTFFN